ncbi:hypothetical protein PG987_002089 [Apiospora arundinis]
MATAFSTTGTLATSVASVATVATLGARATAAAITSAVTSSTSVASTMTAAAFATTTSVATSVAATTGLDTTYPLRRGERRGGLRNVLKILTVGGASYGSSVIGNVVAVSGNDFDGGIAYVALDLLGRQVALIDDVDVVVVIGHWQGEDTRVGSQEKSGNQELVHFEGNRVGET